MSGDIIIHLREILSLPQPSPGIHTDTKKLLVPSDRANIPGNNLIHVSSPYITIRSPVKLACESQVSWNANVDEVSDSAILRIASRKLGMEPVVKAFILGNVTVGGNACAVNGHARPDDTCLPVNYRLLLTGYSPLNPIHRRIPRKHKITTINIIVSKSTFSTHR